MSKYRPIYSGLNTLNGTNIQHLPILSRGGEAKPCGILVAMMPDR